jgi:hypothetical protein
MAKTKYGHLVRKLEFVEGSGKTQGTAGLDYVVRTTGKDLEGLNLYLGWGFASKVGELSPGRSGGHAHPNSECLVVVGLDYNNPNYLGAEIEMAMGKEGEKHVFDTPTVVVAPAGFPHGPVVIRKVDKPYGALMIYLGGEYKVTELPDRPRPSGTRERKYGHLVRKLDLRDTKRKEGGNADFIAGWNGKDMEGFELNFTWAFHTGLGAWHTRDPHTHPADECLLFVGLDPNNPDYLGAEIEIAMGKEQEKHVFDTPTVVVVPRGLVHCPLITRRVDKPYGFSAISLNTGHETTWLG